MSDLIKRQKRSKQLTARELSVFCDQISIILKSGLPLHHGLGLLCENVSDSWLQGILKFIANDVTDNKTLYSAIQNTGAFPEYVGNMINIGSESGKLDDAMQALSEFYSREADLKENIKSAVVYPTILILMMTLVMMVLSIKVLPIFSEVFKSLGTTMSPFAVNIMNIGMALGKYSFIILGILALILLIIFISSKTEKGLKFFSGFLSRGKLSEKISLSRFTSSMAMMLASGLDTEHAMELSTSVIGNTHIKEKVNSSILLIKNNTSFIDALYKSDLFPNFAISMISLGFKAGSLDIVMKKVADSYEEEVQSHLVKRVSLIEPISVGVLSVLVGIILISVMLPLMGVMSQIG
ncbi:MAG: type II secretion system F family protein [Eubacteriales bacterium]